MKKQKPCDLARILPIQKIIPTVLESVEATRDPVLEKIKKKWEIILGPRLAKNTHPGMLQRRTLQVLVSHSTWLFEVKQVGERKILARLQEEFGPHAIKRIQLRIDPDAAKLARNR